MWSVYSRAPGAQSVATRAVNPEVVSSNPSSANILSVVWQKAIVTSAFIFLQWANSLCGKNIVRITGVRKPGNTWVDELASVIWLNNCSTALNPNQSNLTNSENSDPHLPSNSLIRNTIFAMLSCICLYLACVQQLGQSADCTGLDRSFIST